MSEQTKKSRPALWWTAPELPPNVFEAWRKLDGALSPVSVVATVDADGAPHTALFGSLRAVTPRLLRLCSMHVHDTYANLCRDGRVTVSLVSPPDVAVSVYGRARVVRERMELDKHFAILEIDVERVKNDMAYRIVIESEIAIHPRQKHQQWYTAAMAEIEELE